MSADTFYIEYPQTHIATEKSQVELFNGEPDLVSCFNLDYPSKERRFFITDANVASLSTMKSFVSKFEDNKYKDDCLLILGSGEKYKTIESVFKIIKFAMEENFNKTDVFVGIGGGVICDITSFAASIFKRGINLEFVPTTLLAMVDACIGGKNACDFENYKNMIGTFFPARKIYYFAEFVLTLPENHYSSGLAEAFKTSILLDKEMFKVFQTKSDLLKNKNLELLKIIIKRCVKAKASIVQKDFLDQSIRSCLNLGHTFAHAYESLSGLGTITHGQAVAWGICRAVNLSNILGYCNQDFKDTIFSICQDFDWDTSAIPSSIKGGAIGERLVSVMHKDKKTINQNIKLILLRNICDVFSQEVLESDIQKTFKQ